MCPSSSAAIELAGESEDRSELEQARDQFDAGVALRSGEDQGSARLKSIVKRLEHRLASFGWDMLQHFGADGDIMFAQIERQGGVLEVGRDGVQPATFARNAGLTSTALTLRPARPVPR